jgi:hypothetical protein
MSILTPAEAVRLLREQWANPTMLAQELFSILTADLPDTLNAPVSINNGNNPPTTPLFQLDNAQAGQQVFSFGKDGSLGNFTFDPNNGLVFNGGGGAPPQPIGGGPAPPPSKGVGAMPGTITGGGPATYDVQLLTSGQTVSAIAWPQVAESADPGTQVWVYLVGNQYYTEVPAANPCYAANITSVNSVSSYLCDLYPLGPGGTKKPGGPFTVTQLLIAGTASLPIGAWDIAVKLGSGYYFQMPVFMGPDA